MTIRQQSSIHSYILFTNTHAWRGRCPNYPQPDTDSAQADELEMDLFTPSVFTEVTTVIWPRLWMMCVQVCVCVCVCVAVHRWQAAGTGAGQ